MKQNRKGFTLIELLAVIVILAIIALIATPIILNMINEARKSAAKSSSLGFIESIESYSGFAEAKATGMDINGYSVLVPSDGVTGFTCSRSSKDGAWTGTGTTTNPNVAANESQPTCATFMAAVEEKSKGAKPEKATVIMNASGVVQSGSKFYFNKYTCTYDGHDIPASACQSGDHMSE